VKILIPVDGPPASIRAVKLAIDQVKTVAGANLVIVNVQNPATLGLAEGAGIMPLAWIERRKSHAPHLRPGHSFSGSHARGGAAGARGER
jgi:hypothetical protein